MKFDIFKLYIYSFLLFSTSLHWQGVPSEFRFQAGSSASARPVGMDLLQQWKSLMSKAIQDLELKLKRELNSATKEHIKLRNYLKTSTESFANWLADIENKISNIGMANSRIVSA